MGGSRVVVLGAGLLFAFVAGLSLLKLIRLSAVEWASTQGEIRRFERMRYSTSNLRPAYEIRVVYAYAVGGRQYEANRVGDDADTVLSDAQTVAALGSVEPTQVTVFYERNNPQNCLLVKPKLWLLWASLVFSLVVSVIALWLFVKMRA